MVEDLLTAHYTYLGQILLKPSILASNGLAGRPLLVVFQTHVMSTIFSRSSFLAFVTFGPL